MNRLAHLAAPGAVAIVLCLPSMARAQVPPPGTDQPPAQPVPTQPAQPAYDPSMQAGGLAPPPPMQQQQQQQPPPGGGTEQQLDRAKKEDSGRGLNWVWLNLEGGFEHVGLQTFNVDDKNFTAGFVESSSSGGVIGGGGGLQLLFFTLGVRARVGFFSAWQLFSVGGEFGFRIPVGNLEPHFDLGFGYTGLGSFSGAIQGANDAISIRGFYGRVGGGLDYFVTPVFSLGANFSWELLGLTRPELSPGDIQKIKSDPNTKDPNQVETALSAEGSSYGSAIALTAVLGLHF